MAPYVERTHSVVLGHETYTSKPVPVGSGVSRPVTVLPGLNGPVLTETAGSKRSPATGVVPVKTHMSVLGQATTAGSRFKPSVRFDHVAAGAPGGPGVGAVTGVVVVGVGSVVVVVVVVVELLTVVVVIAGDKAAESCVRAALWGLWATPTPAAASEVTASIDIGASRQRLETNRVTTPLRPPKSRYD